ncbi:hypothetical protein PVAP13_5NG012656 [Panicum virgatum]|uniref:Uncharacterized protein n=1 Tax=Panicum virgatum TaxID=38727 RepID=A0A8T0S8G2_PANVG|nr:hypothetical protein PVAP13_5NG012656 [Panicum virgatum]
MIAVQQFCVWLEDDDVASTCCYQDKLPALRTCAYLVVYAEAFNRDSLN